MTRYIGLIVIGLVFAATAFTGAGFVIPRDAPTLSEVFDKSALRLGRVLILLAEAPTVEAAKQQVDKIAILVSHDVYEQEIAILRKVETEQFAFDLSHITEKDQGRFFAILKKADAERAQVVMDKGKMETADVAFFVERLLGGIGDGTSYYVKIVEEGGETAYQIAYGQLQQLIGDYESFMGYCREVAALSADPEQ